MRLVPFFYKIIAVNPAACFALSGQSYICDRKTDNEPDMVARYGNGNEDVKTEVLTHAEWFINHEQGFVPDRSCNRPKADAGVYPPPPVPVLTIMASAMAVS